MTEPRQFERVGDNLLVRAPAKLNLSLLIAGKRPDGFHEIETVMAKINWYDEIRIESAGRPGIEFSCAGPRWAPQDPTNLVYRAAEEIHREIGRAPAVRLTLIKNIPAGSGLGSASSDAAATLLGLNAFLNLGLPQEQLVRMAARLGSDVAFFLNGPLAYCTGRGEKIAPLTADFPFAALLVLPNVNSSTKTVYANYQHDPLLYQRLHATIGTLLEKNRVDSVARICANMLETSCFQSYEELGKLRQTVASLDVGPVCLSGSGSTLFMILDRQDREQVESLRDRIAEKTGCESTVVRNNTW
ncbi:MAG: 4-(cytidine 5'-diphospho)-2-C-methyl-D-erythritol kinase [Planctomycetes bacterium]|nr:4-(cytidine 5'-diphospho)-2-C-methyl-D-erythritol kinase [Planctomycetota bacterium]